MKIPFSAPMYKHVTDINDEGHINHNVNLAIKLGVKAHDRDFHGYDTCC